MEGSIREVNGEIVAITELKELKKNFFVTKIKIGDVWYSVAGSLKDKPKLEEFVSLSKNRKVIFTAKEHRGFWNAEFYTLKFDAEEIIEAKKVIGEKPEDKRSKVDLIKGYENLLNTCMKIVNDLVEFNPKFENKRQELTSTLFIALERRLKDEKLL